MFVMHCRIPPLNPYPDISRYIYIYICAGRISV